VPEADPTEIPGDFGPFSGTRLEHTGDVTTIIGLLVLGAIAYRVLTPDERQTVRHRIELAARWVNDFGRPQLEPFRAALRTRTRWTVATPALLALNIAMFLATRFDPHRHDTAIALVGWGASFGPRTTNGEWWRLVTATFVHRGLPSFLVNMAVLIQIGVILERIVGPLAFLATYVTAGVFAGLAGLTMQPIAVIAGASGAVSGLYGLLLASAIVGWRRPSAITMPVAVATRLAPVTAIFVLHCAFADGLQEGALVGLVAGLLVGVFAAKGLSDHAPPTRRILLGLAAAGVLAGAIAIPLRGITDVRPEIQRLMALERRTAGVYEAASGKLKTGKVSANQLADLIDRDVVPDLQAAETRIGSLRGVRGEDEHRIAEARQYLRLRSAGWRLRADGLRKASATIPDDSKSPRDRDAMFRARAEARHRSTTSLLAKAEEAERESLEAFDRLQQSLNN
jgi:membrane associated rhomboid family serine protease